MLMKKIPVQIPLNEPPTFSLVGRNRELILVLGVINKFQFKKDQ